jgi:hypothetical protein
LHAFVQMLLKRCEQHCVDSGRLRLPLSSRSYCVVCLLSFSFGFIVLLRESA